MALRTRVEQADLAIETPFEIARGRSETAANVFVRITDEDGNTGYGGVSPAAYYGETADSVAATLPGLLEAVAEVGDPDARQRIERRLRERAPDQPAARSAVSIAVHDLVAKRNEVPLYRLWGLDPDAAPPTSYTIGIEDPAAMADRARAARDRGFDVLKVKLGAGGASDPAGVEPDRRRLEAVREAVPDATLRVDVNGGWTVPDVAAAAGWLAEADVALLEQPVPGEDLPALSAASEAVSIPVAADEACVTAADVPAVADAVDIVVVKLSKCGGLRAARRQIATARAHDLAVMLGCMVESQASLAAACHLAPEADFADLDGSLLLAEDPYEGIAYEGNKIALGALGRNGSGARPG